MFLLATLVYTNSVRCIDHKMKHIQYYSSCYTTLQTSRQHSFDRFRYFYHIRDHSLHYNFFRRVYRIYRQGMPLHTPPCLCDILLDNYYRFCYRSLRRNLSHSLRYMIQWCYTRSWNSYHCILGNSLPSIQPHILDYNVQKYHRHGWSSSDCNLYKHFFSIQNK